MPGRQRLRTLLRIILVAALVAGVTILDYRVFNVNPATAGFTYLASILILATQMSLMEAITASIASVVAYNFFFLPPVGTFTIADPQNWVALFTFLLTAMATSQLSSRAREQAKEARSRQHELQHMYEFSRSMLMGVNDETRFDLHVVRQVVTTFQLNDASLYLRANRSSNPSAPHLLEVAETGRPWRSKTDGMAVLPIRLGMDTLGSIAFVGDDLPSQVALEGIAQLIAIAIERARMQETAARLEVTRENERLKSTLLDALAHEFKTPLTAIKGATTTILSSQLSESAHSEMVSTIDEEADRLNRLVTDSIELARLGSETPIIAHTESYRTEELIVSALKELRGSLDGRRFVTDLAENLPAVSVDKHLTELAFRQIFGNAVKYSPPVSPIRITAQLRSNMIAVSVQNQGQGVEKSDQPHVFDKFFRGREVRHLVPGTGLGLSIAREIIEAQGGNIALDSEPGQGVIVTVTLPISL